MAEAYCRNRIVMNDARATLQRDHNNLRGLAIHRAKFAARTVQIFGECSRDILFYHVTKSVVGDRGSIDRYRSSVAVPRVIMNAAVGEVAVGVIRPHKAAQRLGTIT